MARKKSRKKAQFGGLSAAAIKRAQEQAKQAAKKPTPKPTTTTKPTPGFTGTRGTFTPPTFSPTAPVQPPVRPPVVQPPVTKPVDTGIFGIQEKVYPPTQPTTSKPSFFSKDYTWEKKPTVSVRRPPTAPVKPTLTTPKPAPQPVVQPKPTKPQPTPEVPDETGGVLRPKPTPTMSTPVATTTDRGDRIPPRTPIAKQPIPAKYTNLAKMHYQTPDSTRTMAPNQAEVVRRAEQEKLRLVQLGEYDKAQEIAVKIGQLSNAQNMARGEAVRNFGVDSATHGYQAPYRQAKVDETNVGFGGLEQYIDMSGIDKLPSYKGTWGKTNPQQNVDLQNAWNTKDPSNLTGPVLAAYNQLYEQEYGSGKPPVGGIAVGGVRPAPQPPQNIETGQRKEPPEMVTDDWSGSRKKEQAQQQAQQPNTFTHTFDVMGQQVNMTGIVDPDTGNRYVRFGNSPQLTPWAGTDEKWNEYMGTSSTFDETPDLNIPNQNPENTTLPSWQPSWQQGPFGPTDRRVDPSQSQWGGVGRPVNIQGVEGDKGFGPRIPAQRPAYKLPERMEAVGVNTEGVPTGQGALDILQTAGTGIGTPDIKPRLWHGAMRQNAALAPQVTDRGFATFEGDIVTDRPEVRAAKQALSQGAISPIDVRQAGLAPDMGQGTAASRDEAQEQAALTDQADIIFDEDLRSQIDPVTGQTTTLSATPDAEIKQRRIMVGGVDANVDVGATGDAAEIIKTAGYEAAQARTFKGEAAKGAAANMVAQVSDLPSAISTAIVEDPAEVEAQIDTQPVEVQAAIAALPTEALVSSQMENLLAGIDQGEVPLWARPAVDLVESNLAQRGLNVSSVGRDALFNSIIQSAMPIAQSNAQALQTRAAQNLSNEQQANLAEVTADMQVRMANLSNQQTAESQTAQMAQNMATLQSQFTQQTTLTSAEQQQQTSLSNLQNRQQAAVIQSQNQQAINAQELGNEQQVELANLQLESATERENISAQNQERLTEMQVAADFISKNAGFKQQMEVANLSNEQQMRLANLTALNQASSENLNAEQQVELANLNKTMQVNNTSAQIAQQMNLAQLNVDQQRAVQNAATVANMDLNKFNMEQQVELANSKFMQTATLADFNAEQQMAMQNATSLASMDMATLDANTKLQAQNAQAFLQMDMAGLNNEQQASMLRSQNDQQLLLSNQAAANASLQFNAASENQVNQYMTQLAQQINVTNAQSRNQMRQFNEQLVEQRDARLSGNNIQVALADAEMEKQIAIFNQQRDDQRYQFNTQNQIQIEQAYLTYLRNASMANTAAQNEANRINVQNSFAMTAAEQANMYQQLRDEAAYIRQSYENDATRLSQLYIAAIGNESAAGDKGKNMVSSMMTSVNTVLGISAAAPGSSVSVPPGGWGSLGI